MKISSINQNLVPMNETLKRRDFLRNMAITGAALTIPPAAAEVLAFSPGASVFKGARFTMTVEPDGFFSVSRSDGSRLFDRCTPVAHTSTGTIYAASPAFSHRASKALIHDDMGNGLQIRLVSTGREQRLQFDTLIRLYDDHEQIVLETTFSNLGREERIITGLESFHVMPAFGGGLHVPGVSRCITNGAMYYDAGRVHTFGQPFPEQKPYGESKGGRFSSPVFPAETETVDSWWNAGFYHGHDKEALVLGYLENRTGLGRLRFSRQRSGPLSLCAESVFAPGTVIKPGQSIHSDRFILMTGKTPYLALEEYASLVGKLNRARVHSIINGWCM